MFGMCFCLSYAGKQKLYGYIQMRPGDDLRLCYQVHNEEYSKKLAVYNLAVGYYLLFLLFWFDALFLGVWQMKVFSLRSLAFIGWQLCDEYSSRNFELYCFVVSSLQHWFLFGVHEQF